LFFCVKSWQSRAKKLHEPSNANQH